MPVQRRVSLAALLLAIATLRLAPEAKNPVATVLSVAPEPAVVTITPVSPAKLAPTPTNKFTPVRSIVSKSDAAPARVTLLLPKVNAPAAST